MVGYLPMDPIGDIFTDTEENLINNYNAPGDGCLFSYYYIYTYGERDVDGSIICYKGSVHID